MKRLTKDHYIYDLDPNAAPAITIASGEELIVETWDVFQGLRDSPSIVESQKETVNGPVTGPIYVEGAMPGDALKIEFISMRAVSDPAQHATAEIGVLGVDMPDNHLTLMRMEGDHILFPGGLKLPHRPDLGQVATTPPYVQHCCGAIGPYGGDMDMHELNAGTTLYLPVFVEGGLLSMGDGHALAGDGTIAGTAAEAELEVHLRITVEKNANLKCPRALTPQFFIVQGFGTDDVSAIKQGVQHMVDILVEEKGMDPKEAYALLSIAGHARATPSDREQLHMSSPKVMLAREVYDQLG
jgi:amidase